MLYYSQTYIQINKCVHAAIAVSQGHGLTDQTSCGRLTRSRTDGPNIMLPSHKVTDQGIQSTASSWSRRIASYGRSTKQWFGVDVDRWARRSLDCCNCPKRRPPLPPPLVATPPSLLLRLAPASDALFGIESRFRPFNVGLLNCARASITGGCFRLALNLEQKRLRRR